MAKSPGSNNGVEDIEKDCETCDGSGACQICNGQDEDCEVCEGSGDCLDCDGSGTE